MSWSSVISIDHPAHNVRGHKLKLQRTTAPFRCDACKMRGFSSPFYSCEVASCTFHLHRHCAEPKEFLTHPFYENSLFRLVKQGPQCKGKPDKRLCVACEKSVEGYFYHCKDSGMVLHPSCANLPRFFVDGELKLELKKKLPSGGETCVCVDNHRKNSWGYVSSCKIDSSCQTVAIHVYCLNYLLLDSYQGGSSGRENRPRSLRKLETMKKAAEAAGSIFLVLLLVERVSTTAAFATLLSAIAGLYS